MTTTKAALHALVQEQVDSYRRDGFLIVRNVFSREEVAELDHDAEELMKRSDLIDVNNIRCRWKDHVQTKACTFECFDPVIDLSPACMNIARDRRILGMLSVIYGEQAHLFKDKLIFKPAGVEGYRLHQDWISWDGFPTTFATVLVPIDDCNVGNGCTVVYPGCHLGGYVNEYDGEYHQCPESWVAGVDPVPVELEAGDIAIFGAFTPHYSDPNRSPQARRQLYLSYNADSDGGDQRDKHYDEFRRWLREKYAQYGKTEVWYR
jgi:ectoine hydroxylase-related dioxygenase (phytanoyl-CoA dioxygenase family)